MKLKLNLIIREVFVVILLVVFLVGGSLQYFVGIPNTVMTLGILGVLLLLILLYTLAMRVLYYDKIFFCCLGYGLIILCSGIMNKAGIPKTLVYCIFPLIPFCSFYVFTILDKRKIQMDKFLQFFFKLVALLQLPIVLIQKFGYDFLINLNNSNQIINEYDFMFGSFFIRGDHSLGFFLLMYLLSIVFNRMGRLGTTELLLIGYISVTILIMGSNLTKLVLIIVLGYYLFLWLYKKINIIGMALMVFVGYMLFNIALLVPEIDGQYQFFKSRYTPEESQIAFDRGYAKRPQIIVVFATNEKLKILGEGPYNYFNIFTGRFKQTQHFSQLIWTYNDLGILGLVTILLLALLTIRSLGLNREATLLLGLIFLMYLLMTNVFSDWAMLFSLLLIRKREKKKDFLLIN